MQLCSKTMQITRVPRGNMSYRVDHTKIGNRSALKHLDHEVAIDEMSPRCDSVVLDPFVKGHGHTGIPGTPCYKQYCCTTAPSYRTYKEGGAAGDVDLDRILHVSGSLAAARNVDHHCRKDPRSFRAQDRRVVRVRVGAQHLHAHLHRCARTIVGSAAFRMAPTSVTTAPRYPSWRPMYIYVRVCTFVVGSTDCYIVWSRYTSKYTSTGM